MKIYFSGSIYGGRQKLDTYKKLINKLGEYGEVLNPEVASDTIIQDEKGTIEDDRNIFESLERRMQEADLIFSEWTIPALGVGYEAGYADKLGKKIIGIFDKNITPKITTMFRGNKRITIIPYEDINEIIDNICSIITENLKEE